MGTCYAKAFKFNLVPFVYFCFYFHYSRKWIWKDIAVIYVKECFAYGSSNSSKAPGLTFRSLIHFENIFVYGVRECFNFILLHVAVQFSQCTETICLLKRLSCFHSMFLCHRLVEYGCLGLFLGFLCCANDLVYGFGPVPYYFNDCSFLA